MTLITDADVPATAEELCERLGQVSAELSALTQSAFASFGHQEAAAVAAGVERVTRGVEALQHQCAGGIESGKAWTRPGIARSLGGGRCTPIGVSTPPTPSDCWLATCGTGCR